MTALLHTLAWFAIATAAHSPQALRMHAVRVLDGDCVEFRIIGRLHAVDAPEMKQLHGPESRKFLEEVLLGRDVWVTPVGRSYNRYVVTVDLGGQDLGLVLTEAGMVWVDPRYNERADYVEAQAEARREQVGLWGGMGGKVPPWEFRNPTKPRVQ